MLLHDPSSFAISAAAVGATVMEVCIAIALAAGWRPRWAAKATAGLFAVYLVAMAASPVRQDVLRYAMPVLIGGALLVSATPTKEGANA